MSETSVLKMLGANHISGIQFVSNVSCLLATKKKKEKEKNCDASYSCNE